ncbi:phosphatase 2C-like domain-containing protein [Melampsora americana]|nr:phosphatase 2C-like domain-containing protein [Melampsora americana]
MIKSNISNRIIRSTSSNQNLHQFLSTTNPRFIKYEVTSRPYSNSTSSTSSTSSSSTTTSSSTSSSPPTNKRALVDLALIATGVISIGTTLIWLKSNQNQKSNQIPFNVPIHRGQFEIPIASHEETDELLKKYEATFKIDRIGNPVYRYDTNHLASNSPIEDDSICTIMKRDQFTKEGDMLFFGVFDGHSGWQTSKLLVNRLVQSVKDEIRLVFKSDSEYTSEDVKRIRTSIYQEFSNSIHSIDFQNQELTPEQTASLQALLPALSGSCALLAYIDTARSKVHVACTGDSRAVMGVWNPSANGGKGQWHGELLSDDQEGLNPKEVERIRSEHPPAERENVVCSPTRAFGDARYKWPVGMQEKLYATFHPSARARRDPPDYLTPPYVTAKPEVTSTAIPTEVETNKPAFIVLATDGLWDRLDTSEVVGLVGSWIDLGTEPIQKSRVMKREEVVKVKVIETLKSVHDPTSGSNQEEKKFIFEDGNVATHLIRNALGGPSREKVSALLSIPAPHSRRYRDDITVTVIFLDPEKTKGFENRSDSQKGDEGVTKIKPELIGLSKL